MITTDRIKNTYRFYEGGASFTQAKLIDNIFDNHYYRLLLVGVGAPSMTSIFDAALSALLSFKLLLSTPFSLAFKEIDLFMAKENYRKALIYLAQVVQHVCLAILLPPIIIISLSTARKIASFNLFNVSIVFI